MPETTLPSVPATASAADSRPRKRGYFNKAQFEDIDMAETILAEDDDPSTNFALDGYLIGERLNPSRAGLLQNGAALILKAKADDLPGYDTAAIVAVQLALSNYRGLETDSDEADSEQVSDRIKRDALLKKINTRRSAIQHAADGIWPYTEESSTALRKAFLLPPNRPLSL